MSKTDLSRLTIRNEAIFPLSYLLEEVMESRIVMRERAECEQCIVSPIDGEISRQDFVTEMIRLKDYSLRLSCR